MRSGALSRGLSRRTLWGEGLGELASETPGDLETPLRSSLGLILAARCPAAPGPELLFVNVRAPGCKGAAVWGHEEAGGMNCGCRFRVAVGTDVWPGFRAGAGAERASNSERLTHPLWLFRKLVGASS